MFGCKKHRQQVSCVLYLETHVAKLSHNVHFIVNLAVESVVLHEMTLLDLLGRV